MGVNIATWLMNVRILITMLTVDFGTASVIGGVAKTLITPQLTKLLAISTTAVLRKLPRKPMTCSTQNLVHNVQFKMSFYKSLPIYKPILRGNIPAYISK